MSKKNVKSENYLERIPVKNEIFRYSVGEDGIVTIEVDNKGLFNRIAQKLFKKPKVSYVHLDEFGSFVWLQIDGQRNITEIGTFVKERFGEKAEPLYERLAKFFQILNSYGFVNFVKYKEKRNRFRFRFFVFIYLSVAKQTV